jgi:hypothetical protein
MSALIQRLSTAIMFVLGLLFSLLLLAVSYAIGGGIGVLIMLGLIGFAAWSQADKQKKAHAAAMAARQTAPPPRARPSEAPRPRPAAYGPIPEVEPAMHLPPEPEPAWQAPQDDAQPGAWRRG